MTRFYASTMLSALLLGAMATVVVGADTPTPLKVAVEALNLKTPSDYFDQDRGRTPALAKGKRPAAVTTDEVVEASRKWDRKRVPVANATYQIYEKIAESKALPPVARLWVRDEWMHPGGQDKYEYRVWRVELNVMTVNVMTSLDAVYRFVIREQRLDRRIALLAAAGYSWLQEPRPVSFSGDSGGGSRIVMFDEGRDGALLVTVVEQERERKRNQTVRVVAFDADGNRHLADRRGAVPRPGLS